MPFVGEIRLFAGTFAPNGWASCEGQVLPISENDVLFNLIGTTYGGDGEETFALPDLRGRVPVGQGKGPSLVNTYLVGEWFGVEEVTLTTQQLPAHGHALLAATGGGAQSAPAGALLASAPTTARFTRDTPATALAPTTVDGTGGSMPHDNRMPAVTVRYIISLFGEYPQPQP